MSKSGKSINFACYHFGQSDLSEGTTLDSGQFFNGGHWTEEKLYYVERYTKAFMVAMAPKRNARKWSELIYIDLLAGPGICKDRDRGRTFEGSPLRAFKAVPKFDRYIFRDWSPAAITALKSRLPSGFSVDVGVGDCNLEVNQVVANLPNTALALAFVDPEGLEVQFSTFQQFAKKRVDVIYLFPSGGILRNIPQFIKTPATMNAFWGDETWRMLVLTSCSATQFSSQQMLPHAKEWVKAFQRRMAGLGYSYSDYSDPILTNQCNAPMYHLLFFSKHSAGLDIWRGIKEKAADGQRSLKLEPCPKPVT